MGFPDRIERTLELAHPPARVWAALTTAEGLGTWFGNTATVDLRPGGEARLTWTSGDKADPAHRARRGADRLRVHLGRVRPCRRRSAPHLRRVHAAADRRRHAVDGRRVGLRPAARRRCTARPSRATPRAGPASWASSSSTSMPPPPDIEAVAEEVFIALADPSRRGILAALAAGGPATATDLATRLPITRQAIAKHLALLADAGLVAAEPGERRRVRYRLQSAPMQVAQQFLAALARDWDRQLEALQGHLDAVAARSSRTQPGRENVMNIETADRHAANGPAPRSGSGRRAAARRHGSARTRSGRPPATPCSSARRRTRRLGDELARERRELPWVPVDPAVPPRHGRRPAPARGAVRRPEPAPRLPLHVRPELSRGCPINSSIADGIDGLVPHLNAHDVTMLLVSEAPLAQAAGVQAAHGLDHPLGLVGRQRLQPRPRVLEHPGADP